MDHLAPARWKVPLWAHANAGSIVWNTVHNMKEYTLAAEKIQKAGEFLRQAVAPTGIPTSDVPTITAQIIRGALTIVGTLFLVLMVYGGFLWMTARGNEDQVTKAKNIVIAAVIGLVVIVGAYAVTNFIVSAGVGAAR